VKNRFQKKESLFEESLYSFLRTKVIEMLTFENGHSDEVRGEKPHVIVVVGVNGTGKTTTIGKLAHRFSKNGLKVLLAGADTFRAAAGEQLSIWAERVSVDIVKQGTGADAASVAFDALNAAESRGVDVLIVDTAGRLHTKVNLMEELKKICRVLKKRMETAPHEVLFVLDATTGQNGLNQVRLFDEAIGVSGIVLTKLDGTAKGGMVVTIHQSLGIPINWVGVGEGEDDLLEFNAEAFVEGLFE
jgi:fused signal recognition particle receptor